MNNPFQTTTTVHNEQDARSENAMAATLSRRVLSGVLVATQGVLSLLLLVYPRAERTTWQSALLWLIPSAALYILWFYGQRRSSAGKWVQLLLYPCLMVDGALSLCLLYALTQTTVLPNHAGAWTPIVAVIAVLLTALLGRERGVALGVFRLRRGLLLLLLLATVFAGLRPRVDNLWPIWGKGMSTTLTASLMGIGGIWGVALMHLPTAAGSEVAPQTLRGGAGTALISLGCVALFALYLSLCLPWPADFKLPAGERLLFMQLPMRSIVGFQLTMVLWMLALFGSLLGSTALGARILTGVFPRWPQSIAYFLTLAPALTLALLPASFSLPLLLLLSPWRFAVCALAGICQLLFGRKK